MDAPAYKGPSQRGDYHVLTKTVKAGKPTVLVFTGNSNTGRAAIEHLQAKYSHKVNVRACVRNLANGRALEAMGIEVIHGDITRPQLLGPVFQDVKTAFFATPGTPNRVDLTRKFFQACRDHGVAHAVFISMLDCDKGVTSYQKQFYEIEQAAEAMAGKPVVKPIGDTGSLKFSYTALRCANFYQNFYGSLQGIMADQSLYYPLGDGPEEGKVAHVDLNDVGEAVACVLAEPERHMNKVYTMLGEHQSGNQLASQICMRSTVHCKYVAVEDEIASLAFQALGMPLWMADGNVEQIKYYRDTSRESEPSTKGSDIEFVLGRKATKFGDFVEYNLKPMLAF